MKEQIKIETIRVLTDKNCLDCGVNLYGKLALEVEGKWLFCSPYCVSGKVYSMDRQVWERKMRPKNKVIEVLKDIFGLMAVLGLIYGFLWLADKVGYGL